MSHQLLIEVPDHVYRSLAEEATAAGKTVAELAGEWLSQGAPVKPDEAPPRIPPSLRKRSGTVLGSLTREEIYDDVS